MGHSITINYVNLDPTPEMAYILGVLKGDGYVTLTPGDGRIHLACNDFPFIASFDKALRSIGLHPYIMALDKYAYSTTQWRLDASGIQFVRWYIGLSLEQIHKMLEQDKRMALAFLKGFYESEGTFRMRYGYISLVNTNKAILTMIMTLFPEYSFRLYQMAPQSNRWGNKPIFHLELNRKVQVQVLLDEIQPCIPRKWGLKNVRND